MYLPAMVPSLLSKHPVPESIPEELERLIQEFARGATAEEFLERCFRWMVGRWGGGRFNLFFRFARLFQMDLQGILETKGYLHCTQMNYLLRVMAVKSGFFREQDIDQALTHSWYIAPHQYLRVRLPAGTVIDVDPWNYQFGIGYGRHGSGFASIALFPVR